MRAVSLFSGAGGMDIGFEASGIDIVWANEFNPDAVKTYKKNHPSATIIQDDIRAAKKQLVSLSNSPIDLVFGGPPCQGFSVAGKMDPKDERNTMIWEFLDVVNILSPTFFVMENVKALGELKRWESVREKIFKDSHQLGYTCFARVFNSADYGVPQKRERVFFVGVKTDIISSPESKFDLLMGGKTKTKANLRKCLLSVGTAGQAQNPITCTAAITLATNPVIRKSPYAGMLFNGMGRPVDFESQANTLPASMGGNKTPIVDEKLLHNPDVMNWVVEYHKKLLNGQKDNLPKTVPSYLRRLTIKEAAAIQTFPQDYTFCGEKSSIYRQIGNAVPCDLAQAVAESIVEIGRT